VLDARDYLLPRYCPFQPLLILCLFPKPLYGYPESLQHLKKQTLSIFYKYAIYKAFETLPERQKGLEAAKLLWHYVTYDCSRHRLIRYKLSLLSKVLAKILLPSHQPLLDW